jgi:hypothetical protein
MYLFKTSGATFDSVIANAKHAFTGMPKDWHPGELVLVSKNRRDCAWGEKQITYTMRLDQIRPIRPGEAQRYWPGNEGRWNYLVICRDTKLISSPFDLSDVIGENASAYGPAVSFVKLSAVDASKIEKYLHKVHSL